MAVVKRRNLQAIGLQDDPIAIGLNIGVKRQVSTARRTPEHLKRAVPNMRIGNANREYSPDDAARKVGVSPFEFSDGTEEVDQSADVIEVAMRKTE